MGPLPEAAFCDKSLKHLGIRGQETAEQATVFADGSKDGRIHNRPTQRKSAGGRASKYSTAPAAPPAAGKREKGKAGRSDASYGPEQTMQEPSARLRC